MTVIERVKRFFANTIAGYAETMREPSVTMDWEIVARKMMYDFRVFNAEICDLPDKEDGMESAAAESIDVEQSVDVLPGSPSSSESTSKHATPVKRGYERDADFQPEEKSDSDTSLVSDEDEQPVKRLKKSTPIVKSIDFTTGHTRLTKKFMVNDQLLCHIILKVLREQAHFNHNNVFYKLAKNWEGEIQKGLVVSSNGDFFVHDKKRGTFKKPVSNKDRFIYHDGCRINAPKLVYCSFTKNHPGLNGESEDKYRIFQSNKIKGDLRVDNLILKKV